MSANKLEVSEVNDDSWIFNYEPGLKVGRTSETVADLLEEHNVSWSINHPDADVLLFKEKLSRFTPDCMASKLKESVRKRGRKYFNLIGEPVELAPLGWFFNVKHLTLSVAPGQKFKRFFFAAEWKDPEVDGWKKRTGEVVYIGRPTPERIRQVRAFIRHGVDIDIYSRQAWPLSQWKGPIAGGLPGEHQALKEYKFRLVVENSYTRLYHSEKLFHTLRAGVIPFYLADPALDLPCITELALHPSDENILNRHDLAPCLLARMNAFMFSSKWEMYSIKNQYLQLLDFARRVAQTST